MFVKLAEEKRHNVMYKNNETRLKSRVPLASLRQNLQTFAPHESAVL